MNRFTLSVGSRHFFLQILLYFLLFSNTANSQEHRPDPCIAISNYAINEAKARKMMGNFQNVFKGDLLQYPNGRSLADSFFIDSCFMRIFKDFISQYDIRKINGFRFVFGTEKEKEDKEVLYMVPTYNNGKRNKNIWDKRLDISEACPSEFSPPPIGERKKLLKRFKRHHRMDGWLSKPKKDNLSRSVWFEACFLNALYDTCKTNGNAGIFIYNAAYDKTETADIPGRKYEKQSTVVIALANKEPRGTLTSDFKSGQDIYKKMEIYYNQVNALRKEGDRQMTLDEYFNHGQLCPQICE